MWSPDRVSTRNFSILIGLAAALFAGGCNVRPLYSTAPVETGSGTTAAALSDVDVAPVEGRVGQKIRNDLLFYLNGGGEGGSAYIVELEVNEKYTNVITRAISGIPGGRNIRLIVTYTLKKSSGGKPLVQGKVTRIASIDYFNQRFANDRATLDAENRAAKEVAADINLRLAAYFATGKSYDEVDPVVEVDDFELPSNGSTIFDERENTYGAPDL